MIPAGTISAWATPIGPVPVGTVPIGLILEGARPFYVVGAFCCGRANCVFLTMKVIGKYFKPFDAAGA